MAAEPSLKLKIKLPTRVQPEVLPSSEEIGVYTNKIHYLRKYLLDELVMKKFAMDFMEPVDTAVLKVPMYYTIIKKPMDVGTIIKRVQNRYYHGVDELIHDFRLVISNCFTFNRPGEVVYRNCQKLEKFFYRVLNKMPRGEEKPSTKDPLASGRINRSERASELVQRQCREQLQKLFYNSSTEEDPSLRKFLCAKWEILSQKVENHYFKTVEEFRFEVDGIFLSIDKQLKMFHTVYTDEDSFVEPIERSTLQKEDINVVINALKKAETSVEQFAKHHTREREMRAIEFIDAYADSADTLKRKIMQSRLEGDCGNMESVEEKSSDLMEQQKALAEEQELEMRDGEDEQDYEEDGSDDEEDGQDYEKDGSDDEEDGQDDEEDGQMDEEDGQHDEKGAQIEEEDGQDYEDDAQIDDEDGQDYEKNALVDEEDEEVDEEVDAEVDDEYAQIEEEDGQDYEDDGQIDKQDQQEYEEDVQIEDEDAQIEEEDGLDYGEGAQIDDDDEDGQDDEQGTQTDDEEDEQSYVEVMQLYEEDAQTEEEDGQDYEQDVQIDEEDAQVDEQEYKELEHKEAAHQEEDNEFDISVELEDYAIEAETGEQQVLELGLDPNGDLYYYGYGMWDGQTLEMEANNSSDSELNSDIYYYDDARVDETEAETGEQQEFDSELEPSQDFYYYADVSVEQEDDETEAETSELESNEDHYYYALRDCQTVEIIGNNSSAAEIESDNINDSAIEL
ncbi:CG7229 [Drosophila busckii]|uniref:CG7229 n=1 Tax=Drosophila busckii TaxID=30019 RepID=A0A0M3QWR8_DROBS|nr:CG7229 [Drosophila busckii]